ncbi:hypothetical protein GmHk_01G001439 [Glycine max]|nr:hypothetical protein GmHk_01G001439 [Glycine max]
MKKGFSTNKPPLFRGIKYDYWNERGSKWKNSSRRMPKDKKDRDKSSIIYYECKYPGHFKSRCPKLEKGQDKKKYFKTNEKKGLMSTWEDLDDTSSGKDDEEAYICLMENTTFDESESDQEDEVNLDDPENKKVMGQPQDVVKLHEEIRTLKTTLAKFVNGTNNLNKMLGYCRSSSYKFGNGYDGKVYVHDKDTTVYYFCGKTGHMTSV